MGERVGKGEKEIASERTRSVFTASRCDWPPLTSAHYGSSFFRYRRGPRDPLLAPFRMYTLLPMNIKAARTLALLATLPLPEHNRAGAYSVALEPRLSGTRVSHSLSHLRYAFTLLFFSSLKQVLVFLSLLSLNRSSFSLACTLVVILLFLFVFCGNGCIGLHHLPVDCPLPLRHLRPFGRLKRKEKTFTLKT